MATVFTPQQTLAMVYARMHAIRDELADADSSAADALCTDFNRALDYLQLAGFDLSSFKLEGEHIGDHIGWLRSRLDSALEYMDLLAGLP